jgi:purine-nucleoside/S-methyl-5'-thioadenosine phosphorylase / adenosine deaminase
MIRPPGFAGAIFGTADAGDPRSDERARRRFEAVIGSPRRWAWANQVHGSTVLIPDRPGQAGDADALLTDDRGIVLLVATADCVPVVIEGERSTAMIHAGWRGMAQGVVAAGVEAMRDAGDRPLRAAIGPSIGPCCYEVGPEVLDALAPCHAVTTWGTPSVDLWAAAAAQLDGLELWRAEVCTFTNQEYLSYRRDGTTRRQVSVTWLPGA